MSSQTSPTGTNPISPVKRRKTGRKMRQTLRAPAHADSRDVAEVRQIFILVMGLTGAGKSTFISTVTGDTSIAIGAVGKLDGETQEVQDYQLLHRQGDTLWDIHLIDSPGFDDGLLVDTDVLNRIAAYINTTYKLKQTLAGILYLHDITRPKMGAAGQKNLRVLEQMIGVDKWDNCTFVTTKWGCTNNPEGELEREKTLMQDGRFFGTMLQSARQASIQRFDPCSRERALAILAPHLRRKFEPRISEQMVDPAGPRLALGETDAGRIVADDLEQLREFEEYREEMERSQAILGRKFDDLLFDDFKAKRDALIRRQRLQKAGRWALRTIIGGSIAATVLTAGPGAAAFALEPAYEEVASRQKREERRAMERLKKDFKDRSAVSSQLKASDPAWLTNRKVQRLEDIDDSGYSIKANRSSTEIASARRSSESRRSELEESESEEDTAEELEELEELGGLGDIKVDDVLV